jgi:hypothetical protein
MLVTFHTPAAGDVIMFGNTAVQLLQLMGNSGKVPGVLQSEDLEQAIRLLKTALEGHSSSNADDNCINKSDEEVEVNDELEVSLRNRAFPLIRLLEAAGDEGVHVTWES